MGGFNFFYIYDIMYTIDMLRDPYLDILTQQNALNVHLTP
jgi:hypothetical protein